MIMMMMFLLYVLFRAIIKAMTVHQNLHIVGERIVFFSVRFTLLAYVMKRRCKRCGFQKGPEVGRSYSCGCLGTD